MVSPKHIILTGATGFVGRHILTHLAVEDLEVTAVYHQSEPCFHNDNINWVKCDLLNPEHVSRLFTENPAEHLIHTAWITTPGVYTNSAQNTKWYQATKDIVAAFSRNGGEHIIMTGTCLEYDIDATEPFVEASTTIKPTTPYAIAKQQSHVFLNDFAKEHNLSVCWARLFYLFGAFEDPKRFIPNLINNLLKGEEFTLKSPKKIRDFLAVDEVGFCLSQMAMQSTVGTYNVGSGNAIALDDLSYLVANLMDAPSDLIKVEECNMPSIEPEYRVADITLTQESLNWQVQYSLKEYMRETITWWRENG